MIEPVGVHVYPVACNTGHIINNGHLFLTNLVEEGGLADIRTADYCNNRFTHIITSN